MEGQFLRCHKGSGFLAEEIMKLKIGVAQISSDYGARNPICTDDLRVTNALLC